jgi:hypothetical protein
LVRCLSAVSEVVWLVVLNIELLTGVLGCGGMVSGGDEVSGG